MGSFTPFYRRLARGTGVGSGGGGGVFLPRGVWGWFYSFLPAISQGCRFRKRGGYSFLGGCGGWFYSFLPAISQGCRCRKRGGYSFLGGVGGGGGFTPF